MTEADQAQRRVTLQSQIVVFLDLLGFQARMTAAGSDAVLAAKLLAEYDVVMREALAVLDEDYQMFKYKGFTDNIVISTPLAHGYHPEERFGVVTNKVAQFQMVLARAGWFVRGGISVGQFYMDERVVFGPALVEAYQLEQKTALFPRVVLSDPAKNWMRSFIEFYGDKYDSPQNLDVLVDIDGKAYVNYLAANFLHEAREITEGDLRAHKGRVETALGENRGDVGVWMKYRWSAQYHDYFVREMRYDEPTLLISPESLRATPTNLCDESLPDDFPVPWLKLAPPPKPI